MRKILLTSLFLCALSALASAQTATGDTQSTPATATTPGQAAQTDANAQPKKKVKHVYTSEDFKPADPKDIASSSGSASSGESGTANMGDAKDDKGAKGTKKAAKKADPEAVAAQQAKVDYLKQQVDGETKVVADIQRLINEEPTRAASMGPGLTKQQSDLTDLKKQLDGAQSQLDAMKNPK